LGNYATPNELAKIWLPGTLPLPTSSLQGKELHSGFFFEDHTKVARDVQFCLVL